MTFKEQLKEVKLLTLEKSRTVKGSCGQVKEEGKELSKNERIPKSSGLTQRVANIVSLEGSR